MKQNWRRVPLTASIVLIQILLPHRALADRPPGRCIVLFDVSSSSEIPPTTAPPTTAPRITSQKAAAIAGVTATLRARLGFLGPIATRCISDRSVVEIWLVHRASARDAAPYVRLDPRDQKWKDAGSNSAERNAVMAEELQCSMNQVLSKSTRNVKCELSPGLDLSDIDPTGTDLLQAISRGVDILLSSSTGTSKWLFVLSDGLQATEELRLDAQDLSSQRSRRDVLKAEAVIRTLPSLKGIRGCFLGTGATTNPQYASDFLATVRSFWKEWVEEARSRGDREKANKSTFRVESGSDCV